jgi:hypothetical protein
MTDDRMNDQPNDQPNDGIQDERIRALAAGHYNAPDGAVPREAMWSQISAARRAARTSVAPVAAAPSVPATDAMPDVVPFDSRRRTRTIVVWRWSAALAAGLLLAFALGRELGRRGGAASPSAPGMSAQQRTAPPSAQRITQAPSAQRIDPPAGAPEGSSSSPAPNGPATRTNVRRREYAMTPPSTEGSTAPPSPDLATTDSAAAALYRTAAVQTLVQAEALLTAYRGAEATTRDPQAMQQAARWARDVLSSTRLLIDSPAGRDPQMRTLFTDLELVLAQIVQLSGTPLQASERELIDRAMRDRDLLPRLRSAVPAGSATS